MFMNIHLVLYSKNKRFYRISIKDLRFLGDKVKKGDILADTSASDHGEIALDTTLSLPSCHGHGNNYEDAIILSESVC
jgi:DNA-directed RNA polymerase subunit beta